MRVEEKNFVDFGITPLLKGIINLLGEPYTYESREAFLKSINYIWKNNGTIRNTSEGFKADGIVRYKQVEIRLVEACGVYGNVSLSKIQFDRHKGIYACLATLRTIAVYYKYASLNSFENLEILFLHSKGNYLQLWSVSFTHDIFVFRRVEKYQLSLDFEFKSQTISNCIKFGYLIKEHLTLTVNLIDRLSTEHTTAINNDIMGISSLNEDRSLDSIVCPRTHKIKDSKGGDAGLCNEDPVSCAE